MHDGNCSNCNGGMSAQQSVLVLSAIVGIVDVAIIAIRPHEDNTGLLTLVDAVLAPMLAQLVGINKTQEVHKALCETAAVSNVKKEEILQAVHKDIAATAEVNQKLDTAAQK